MPFQKHVRPKLRKLKDRLTRAINKYYVAHPYGKGDAESQLKLLKNDVDTAFRKIDEEMAELFDNESFLRDLLDSLDRRKRR
ncbi:hypothetical protein KJ765_06700 [Candidatus Micrarchaeota archaeon]|nr:hypothetical protein [Candidatus Micrarchaeota archaeon]